MRRPPRAERSAPHVLLVEDDPAAARATLSLLAWTPSPMVTCHVPSVGDALAAIERERFDAVLLDLSLPDTPMLEAIGTLSAASDAPVIGLAEDIDDALAEACVTEGAQDCLHKAELTARQLHRAIRYAVERLRKQSSLRMLSLTDELTGLYNRRGFTVLGGQQVRLAERSGRGLVLACVDLDGLKRINDTYGHAEGDIALVQTADILRTTFRSVDLIARIGGDEFVALAVDAQEHSEDTLLARLQTRLEEHNVVSTRGYPLSFSVGLARFRSGIHHTLDELLADADRRLYLHKRSELRPAARVLAFRSLASAAC